MFDDVSHAEGGGGLVKNLHNTNANTAKTEIAAAEAIVGEVFARGPIAPMVMSFAGVRP